MNFKPLQISLLVASAAMIGGAGLIWSGKTRALAAREKQQMAQQAVFQTVRADAEKVDARGALALLELSTRADNQLTYSALSQTTAFLGGKSVASSAKITRAPRHLCIETLSGLEKGARSGYSQKWFWRQSVGQKMQPYAEVRLPADAMAFKRLALLTQNYRVSLGESKNVGGRAAQAIELRPNQPIDGAKGPARRLWIDQKSGLTLGIESFNCDLKLISRSTLSNLQIAPPIAPATFEKPAAIFASLQSQNWQGEELGDDFQSAIKKTGFVPPKPTFLPPGFELDGYGVHRCLTTGTLQPAAFSRFSDGLNTLTVFAFKPVNSNIAKNMRGGCNFGPGALGSREDNGGRLVALGDLPAKTLARVLDSAQFEMAR